MKEPCPVVLRIEGLSKAFGGLRVLDGVVAEVRQGEVVVLRGDNGTGKTTLLNILTGNLEADSGRIDLFANGTQEHFRFPRRWWEDINPLDHFTPERMAWAGVGRTWQDVRLFGTQSLRDNLAVAVPSQRGERLLGALTQPWRVRRYELLHREDASKALRQLGLDGREDSSGDRISLGQSKRVAIARAVQAGARILFLDEPLAGLDQQGIDQVLKLLEQLARQQQITMVIVEHVFHIRRLLDLADHVWTLADGRLVVESPAKVRREYTEREDDGLRRWLEQLAGPRGRIMDQDLAGGALLSIARRQPDRSDEPLLDVCDLVVRRGRRLVIGQEGDGVVQGFSFAVREGEVATLQAPNGWGKTTLLEAIAGLLPVERGVIRLRGQRIDHLSAWQRARAGLRFLQSRNALFPGLTVEESLRLADLHTTPTDLRSLQERRVGSLSGGERQRVALACALGKDGIGRLLDEPFGMLDDHRIRAWERQVAATAECRDAVLLAVPGKSNHRRD